MVSKKLIVYISTNADEAGAPRHVEMLVNGFSKKYNIMCIFGEDGPVAERIKRMAIKVAIVPQLRSAINPFKDLVALIGTIKVLRSLPVRVVHCHSAKAGLVGRLACVFLSVPCIYTVHGWGWRGLPFYKSVLVKCAEKAFSILDGVSYIYVSKSVESESIGELRIPQSKSCVIYNGVPQAPNQEILRNLCNITIIMPARVCDAKDHVTLLKAFAKLDKRYKLILCGAGTDSHKFKETANAIACKNANRILFVGETNDIYKYYFMSDVFVLISNFEALPVSIIEAMSCGIPVIASKVGGIPEMIEDGYTGYLVPHANVEILVARIRMLEDLNLRQSLSRNCLLSYHKKFGVDKMLKSVDNIYQSVITKNTRQRHVG
ncbi:MAG: glycosyltransferase family 4 protein [Bacteroidetes bacterium]|nr:glycosyltransferase family 4 protein [Bacteroidota bacterium]